MTAVLVDAGKRDDEADDGADQAQQHQRARHVAHPPDPLRELEPQGAHQGGPGVAVAAAMARRTSVGAGVRAERPALERVELAREHQHLLAGPDHAHDEQGEDQLADVGVVGGQDPVDPALHPHRAQEHEAGAVDQQEAEQEEKAVAADGRRPPRARPGASRDLAPGSA